MGPAAQRWQAVGGQLLAAGSALFCSELPEVGNGARRGGVPVIFPQFAQRGVLPKHGFARSRLWQQRSADAWQLNIAPTDDALWPYAAQLDVSYVPHIKGEQYGGLLRLAVCNTGADAFECTGGLHPYWAVRDVREAVIEGAAGLQIEDKYDASRTELPSCWKPSQGQVVEVLISAAPDLLLRCDANQLRLKCAGFDEWMVWNPGAEESKQIVDLASGAWKQFICIEPVCVKKPMRLLPGQERSFELVWEVECL
jgi:glucose-6-phosphate 1-epimerase